MVTAGGIRRMRVYHFIDEKYGLRNIRERHLKIATIDKLNDPFEFLGVASKDARVRKRYAQLKADLSKFMGVVCFSANWKNPVQWSHYANRHQGLCLGFDVTDKLHKVTYVKRRLRPNVRAMNSESTAKAHVQKMITTKFSHWHYENEYRVFAELKDRDEAGLYFVNFRDTIKLREVIVGHRSPVTRAELAEAVGDLQEVRFFKSRLAFR